jgi:predicted acylesterase/phospholipase RssA
MTMSAATRHSAWLLLVWAVAVLAGCTSLGPELPMASGDEPGPQELSLGVRTLGPDGEFEVLPSSLVARRLETRFPDRPLSLLALSGGGASGAFGAGAVVGLTRSGGRPEFSVVTGVSAGALIAPFAFLGPSWDPEMAAIYTEEIDKSLLQPRLIGAVFGSSMYSGTPLRRLIDRYADDRMMEAVATEAARGRLLLVATTDFATGEPVIWDLGSIALYGGRDARQLFRSVLLASASVPGMFPPVVIKVRTRGGLHEETHVDGGVTLPFFVAPAPEDLPQFTGVGGQPTVVRIIIDGRLRELPRGAKANALSIFSRSVSAGLNRMTRTTLEQTVAASRGRGIALDYAAIPVAYPLQGSFNFDPEAQRALFTYASTCAEAGRLWTRIQQTSGDPAAERRIVSAGMTCPADDQFIGRFAALENRAQARQPEPSGGMERVGWGVAKPVD